LVINVESINDARSEKTLRY